MTRKSSDNPNKNLQDITVRMNKMYALTRHIYDLTRKFYLLGRDRLIEDLQPNPGHHIVEIGCGTARNLIKMAQRYPECNFYGIDASEELLKTAKKSIKNANLENRITLMHGFAQNFSPKKSFGIQSDKVDRIVFSYTLSMIAQWQDVIEHALPFLTKDGALHLVDFGDLKDLPRSFRNFLFWWLSLFGCYYRSEMAGYLENIPNKKYQSHLSSGGRSYYLTCLIKHN